MLPPPCLSAQPDIAPHLGMAYGSFQRKRLRRCLEGDSQPTAMSMTSLLAASLTPSSSKLSEKSRWRGPHSLTEVTGTSATNMEIRLDTCKQKKKMSVPARQDNQQDDRTTTNKSLVGMATKTARRWLQRIRVQRQVRKPREERTAPIEPTSPHAALSEYAKVIRNGVCFHTRKYSKKIEERFGNNLEEFGQPDSSSYVPKEDTSHEAAPPEPRRQESVEKEWTEWISLTDRRYRYKRNEPGDEDGYARMKVAMKSTESQRVKISVEWRHERSDGLVDFNWMPILRLEFTVLNYTPFELLMQNSALASYSLPQCPAVPDPFLTYQHVQNQDDCVYMLADLRCIDKKLHGEIFPMEERTRAKQRSNTTNVSPHITSTGKCDRSLSGANFYTSLRLLFSLTLNLIGKRVRPILPLGKSRYGKVLQHNIYGTIRVTAAMCKRATSALQQGLPPLYEGYVYGAETATRNVRNEDQNGTTTSGNHVGAVVTSVAKLDMTFHPPLASLREGCGEVNVQRAFYLRPEPVPKQLERRDDLLAEGHASIHSHPDSEHPDKAGKDQQFKRRIIQHGEFQTSNGQNYLWSW
ncbi:hypothetical protein T4B_13002 [Trichinella pseudospiralis]|uniref:Uncharacterized protein n=1 Tax=Trichinella pseudospiralis TaxID=6337 RepID=A0A0V1H8F1_TRIPS|nr:hypothetical protein T4B_13002 [Trichinella pseudospiralis]